MKRVLGLFLTGHPIDDYEELSDFVSRLAELKPEKKAGGRRDNCDLRTTKGREETQLFYDS